MYNKYTIAAMILTALSTIYWIAFCINSFNQYHYGIDLSIFNYDMFYHVNYPAIVGGLQYLVFGNHIAPMQLLVVPFYALFQSPLTLLLIQVFVLVGLTGAAVYMISKDLLGNDFLALAICFAYLINPGMHGSVIFDYHVEYLIPLFFLLLFYFYMKNKRSLFILFLVLLLGVMESTFYVTLTLGIALFVYEYRYNKQVDKSLRRSRMELIKILILSSIASFVLYAVLSNMIMGSYVQNPNTQLPPLLQLLPQFSRVQSYVSSAISNPSTIFQFHNSRGNLHPEYSLAVVFLGFGITALLVPELAIILTLPWFAIGFLGDTQFLDVFYHYYTFVLGGIIVATLLSFEILKDRDNASKFINHAPIITICLSSLILILSPLVTHVPYIVNTAQEFFFAPVPYQQHINQVNSMLSLIPNNASVVTMPFIMSHLSQRKYLDVLSPTPWFIPNYILIDFYRNISFDSIASYNYAYFTNLSEGSNYTLVAGNISGRYGNASVLLLYKNILIPKGPYMSEREAMSVVGLEDVYNFISVNTTDLSYLYTNTSRSYITNNLTAAWFMQYLSYPDYKNGIKEEVYATPNPIYLYNRLASDPLVNLIKASNQNTAINNATLNGMTYSIVSRTSSGSQIEVLYGMKNGKVAYVAVTAATNQVNNTSLINAVANDLK